jgi:hypothetical protein
MRSLSWQHALFLTATVLFGDHILVLGLEPPEDNSMNAIQVKAPEVASTRAHRFPSNEERLKLYMSNWYVPPCPDYEHGQIRYGYNSSPDNTYQLLLVNEPFDRGNTTPTLQLDSIIEPDMVFYIDRQTLMDCRVTREDDNSNEQETSSASKLARIASHVQAQKNMLMYCLDAQSTLLRAIDHVDWEREETNDKVPVLLQFGDLRHSHVYGDLNVPHFKKFRPATTRHELDRVTSKECYNGPRDIINTVLNTTNLQAIVWKLATRRHFGLLDKVSREDTPWSLKLDMAVFRGQLTGSKDGFDKSRSDEENCLDMRRCRLVYTHAKSTLVHARLTSTRKKLPHTLNGVNLMGSKTTIQNLLQYKGIIMLEGNDVASGLKWALLSQSVVLMPTPTHTSWAMEEFLEPWVHYIPLNVNATDVDEKMQWVIDHDDFAQRIAERGTLWMEDLVFHPDAEGDDRWIQEEMVRRYQAHFTSSSQ